MSTIRKDENELIQVDSLLLCIGCSICSLACPFGVIAYTIINTPFKKRLAVKCVGCMERLKN